MSDLSSTKDVIDKLAPIIGTAVVSEILGLVVEFLTSDRTEPLEPSWSDSEFNRQVTAEALTALQIFYATARLKRAFPRPTWFKFLIWDDGWGAMTERSMQLGHASFFGMLSDHLRKALAVGSEAKPAGDAKIEH